MRHVFDGRAGLICASFVIAADALAASDASLKYKTEYLCGGDVLYVEYCRRDSDRPGERQTPEAENYCQLYYLNKKTRTGGTLFAAVLRTDIEKTLRLDPDDLETRRGLGISYYQLKRDADAVVELKRVLERKPNDAEFHTWVGTFEYNLKRYADALANYQAAVRIQPDSAAGWYGLGMTQVRLGRKADAQQSLAKLQPLDPKQADELNGSIARMN